MPRQDLDNRDRVGQFQNRYGEPLSSQKIGVYLFESDDARVREIAQKLEMSATEVVRYLVREGLKGKLPAPELENCDEPLDLNLESANTHR